MAQGHFKINKCNCFDRTMDSLTWPSIQLKYLDFFHNIFHPNNHCLMANVTKNEKIFKYALLSLDVEINQYLIAYLLRFVSFLTYVNQLY